MHFSKFQKKYKRIQRTVLAELRRSFLRFKATEHTFIVIVATFIGLIGGFGAVGIQLAIKFFQKVFWHDWTLTTEYLRELPWTHKLLAPALGGLIVGLIIHYISKEAKGHGVPEVMEAIALKNGVIRPRVVLAKLLASSIYIGAGGSVGREGPVIQIGASIGSTIGQFFRVNTQRMKTFVACGAAAGIAAAFNAPIAGALFSVEIILGDFAVPQFSAIVVSSVVATVVTRTFLGNYPAFVVPQYQLVSPFELLSYAGLGIFAGFVALLFINSLYKSEIFFDRVKMPIYLKTLIGGLMVGVLGLGVPQVFGVGYDTMEQAMRGGVIWQWMLLLVFAKIIATSISLGSGGSGGIFAPSLFMGTMIGGFFGEFIHAFWPHLTAQSGAYALVGMGAVVAAATHAPITAILIIFEMTNDYKIILPLMISVIIATLISTKIQKESIYTIKLIRRGIDIFKGRDVNILRSIQVRDVMDKDVQTVPNGMPFRTLMKQILESPHPEFFVVNKKGELLGIVGLPQVREAIQDEEFLADLVVAEDLRSDDVPTISENETLDNVLKIISRYDVELIPVVAEDNPRKIVGQLRSKNIMEAYNKELSNLDVATELAQSVKFLGKAKTLDFVDGYALAEIPCPQPFVDHSLRDLDLRAEYGIQVILIKRPGARNKEASIVPTPAETLRETDKLVVVGPEKAVEMVKNL